jgi:hypothetical protein
MKFDDAVAGQINALRLKVQKSTPDIDAGESVTIGLWWTFICDHARCHGIDPKQLARGQLEAFLKAEPLRVSREH